MTADQLIAALGEVALKQAEALQVPGYLLAVNWAGQSRHHAQGLANLNTRQSMSADTLFALGSVTKLMTAQLLLRHVQDGRLALDDPAVDVLPEFRLSDGQATKAITIRQLLNHSNGIDADLLMPDREFGPAAVASYIDAMADCGTLFAPGGGVHYSNPGFCVAARIIESLSGQTFNQALQQQLFAPAGMSRACTSAQQAILWACAAGSFPSQSGPRPSQAFAQVAAAAGAGSTAIGCLDDLLRFGRLHLDGGRLQNGRALLDEELVRAMRRVECDAAVPDAPPVGLAWWLAPLAGTQVAWHGGGSPGGSTMLVLFAELNLIIAAYGNSASAPALHDAVLHRLCELCLDQPPELPCTVGPAACDLNRYAGDYSAFQVSSQVRCCDDGLEVRNSIVPVDQDNARCIKQHLGGSLELPPTRYVPINQRSFAPEGVPLHAFSGLWGRLKLLSFMDGPEGQIIGHHSRSRFARRC